MPMGVAASSTGWAASGWTGQSLPAPGGATADPPTPAATASVLLRRCCSSVIWDGRLGPGRTVSASSEGSDSQPSHLSCHYLGAPASRLVVHQLRLGSPWPGRAVSASSGESDSRPSRLSPGAPISRLLVHQLGRPKLGRAVSASSMGSDSRPSSPDHRSLEIAFLSCHVPIDLCVICEHLCCAVNDRGDVINVQQEQKGTEDRSLRHSAFDRDQVREPSIYDDLLISFS